MERLLHHADRHYLALEWWSIQEWLGSPTLLLSIDAEGNPNGLVLAVTGDGPVAWLRAVVTTDDECLKTLLEASARAVVAQGGTGLGFLGGEKWISSKLRQVGFKSVNRVVTLRHRGDWPANPGPPDLQLQTATLALLDDVLAVDHVAFAPMWWYTATVLRRALSRAWSFRVAYLADVCVGYQLSTLREGRGHIVRLAAHPDWQGRGIGGRLLSEALATLKRGGAERITVNTQEDNLTSLRLYHHFNFQRVGRPWTVWFKSLERP